MNTIKIASTREVTPEDVWSAFVGAFEGGSNHWLKGAYLMFAECKPARPKVCWYGNENIYEGPFSFKVEYDNPESNEGDLAEKRLSYPEDVERGLTLMAEKSPKHFSDLFDDPDAETYDVLMQYIVLGDVIYG